MPAEPYGSRAQELGRTFGALADPARLAVVALLRTEPLRSGEIASRLALSRPLMSKHLRVLREDNGTTGEMTLLGPIRSSPPR